MKLGEKSREHSAGEEMLTADLEVERQLERETSFTQGRKEETWFGVLTDS